MKGDIIHGYVLTSDWKVVGGMSEVAFAQKGGKEWFIKKFISPKYPTPDSPGSERVKAQRKKNCEEFEARQKELNDKIGSKCGLGGNLIYAVDFFRVDTLYYKINEKIDVSSISIDEIHKLKNDDIMIILKSLAHSLRIMHREGIVHGDLKPDNILIKTTATGSYTTKLIDFDDSYFSGRPPQDREQVVGTPEYYSPELFEYISDEDEEVSPSVLTTQSDIFALGVIFCEYLTGEKPLLPSGYKGTYSAVKAGKPISFKKSKNLTPSLQLLLSEMLALDAKKRPNIDIVLDRLKHSDRPSELPESVGVSVRRFTATPASAKLGEKVTIEWDVENAKEIRIDGGLPLPKRGRKVYSAKESFIMCIVAEDGKVKEEVLRVAIDGAPSDIESAPSSGESKLRGLGLKIARKE